MRNVLRNARKGGSCGQVWQRKVLGIMKGTEEKEERRTEGMMIGTGVGGDTETMKDFGAGVGQQDGLGIIMIEAQDINEKSV